MATHEESHKKVHLVSAQEFSELISAYRPNIIHAFLEQARAAVPAARTEPTVFLKNHLPDVLQKTSDFLGSGGIKTDREALVSLGAKHGEVRAQAGGYTMSQIRREYSILRQEQLKLLPPDHVLSTEAVNLYAESCEILLSTTTESFVRLGALALGPH